MTRLVLALCALSALLAPVPAQAAARATDLRLAYGSQILGELEPCG